MGQKVHPYGFRLGVVKTWKSKWYEDKNYATWLHEDLKLKKRILKEFVNAGIADIEIERAATKAKVVIAECTFFEPDHKARSKIGKHIHVDDLQQLLEVWEAETVVLVHVSRRTNIGASRDLLARQLGDAASRVVFLMDHGTNRARYEQQQAASEDQ